jgi:hypothetical protein
MTKGLGETRKLRHVAQGGSVTRRSWTGSEQYINSYATKKAPDFL